NPFGGQGWFENIFEGAAASADQVTGGASTEFLANKRVAESITIADKVSQGMSQRMGGDLTDLSLALIDLKSLGVQPFTMTDHWALNDWSFSICPSLRRKIRSVPVRARSSSCVTRT